jgi:hypothetical protein
MSTQRKANAAWRGVEFLLKSDDLRIELKVGRRSAGRR